jgi:MFS family permease
MPRVLDFLRTHDIPRMSRLNYTVELNHMLLWGVLAGTIEGNTSSIVVAKTFGASPFLVTVVWATPMFANMLSLVWGAVIRGRPRKPLFIALNAAAIASLASIALTPSDRPWGGWMFAGQIALSRIFLAGLVTVRTSIWSQNYPDACRALITGRLQSLRMIVALFATTSLSLAFNQHPEYYRFAYPIAGLIGFASLWPLRRLRVRQESRRLRDFRIAHAGQPASSSWTGLLRGMRDSVAILRRDRNFARYCTAQFYLGSAAFMVEPVLAVLLTKKLKLDYFSSSGILDLIPNVVALLAIPLWSRMFDRIGVLRFRVVSSCYWFASTILATVAVFTLESGWTGAAALGMVVLIAARIVQGVGQGGGTIAWNLGHLHFAGRHEADLYMGIHVALTGLRGIVMPFVGVAIFSVAGWSALAIAAVLAGIAVWLYHRLAASSEAPAVA